MKCTIVYDNEKGEELENGWGFSAYIEAHGKKILFDTGDNGPALMANLKSLSINPKELDIVFISHGHGDHTGGLGALLPETSSPKLYFPASASSLGALAAGKAEAISVTGPIKISEGIWSTGELAGIEQSLVVSTEKGNLVVCGCGHPGLDHIIEKAKQFGEVYGAIGGFHGFSNLEALAGLQLISPCHCTSSKQEILEKFPNTAKACMAGKVFEV